MMKYHLVVLLALLWLAPPLFAKVVTVYVYNNEFSIFHPSEKKPATPAVIQVGDTIRWQWVQGGHTTTAVAGSPEQWDVIIDMSNQVFERQFNNPGVFDYYCIPHAGNMRSTIAVHVAGSGACCLPDGSCVTTTQGDCALQGGVFRGTGTLCDTINCPANQTFQALKDNTLYESANGTISNGKGTHFFAGRSNSGIKRGLLAFDLSSIPAHAIITSVQLKLYCNNNTGTDNLGLHRVLKNWGEGNSVAGGQETNGTTALSGDATWLHTFYPDNLWTNAGGDYAPSASATTLVNATGTFTWSSMQLTHDVQHWVADSAMNFGWLVKCSDESTTNILKRFSSLQNATIANRPTLIVEYTVPPVGACCLPDGSCDQLTEAQCLAQSGTFSGNGISCMVANCTIELTPFADALPIPGIATPLTGAPGLEAHYEMKMTEQFQQLHRDLPPTRVWGYNGGYPGPIMLAHKGKPITVDWINDLRVAETQQLRTVHAMYVDTCVHGPHMTGQAPVTVVHLHGGKVSPQSDGHPDSTFGPGQRSSTYHYPNDQPAATIWYHDHALGITRLNVMMGLAGLYYIRDSVEQALDLPRGEYDIPLVIQDKSLAADGTMIYPEKIEDHFFGNFVLVNGKVWPYLNVKKGKYRFRLVNGSNSRAYTLKLSNNATYHIIGTDLGLLRQPTPLQELTILPGERYEVIIDFSAYPTGTEIILTNSAPTLFPGFPGVGVIPNVMKFVVQAQSGFTNPIPANLASIETLAANEAHLERDFKLFTVQMPLCGDHGGHGSNDMDMHPVWTINGKLWNDITEYPMEGTTEIWSWENVSGIDHPMHLHLVMSQILDRQPIDANGNPTGPVEPPYAYEMGWKDTWNSPTGYRTRTIARFTGFTGRYPYHCHILEHEDHEMMRQFEVVTCKVVSNAEDGKPGSLRFAIDCANPGDTIYFSADLAGLTVQLDKTIIITKKITLLNNLPNPVIIDGTNTNSTFQIETGAMVEMKNINIKAGKGQSGRGILNKGILLLDQVNIFDSLLGVGSGNTLINTPGSSLTTKNNCGLYIIE